AQTLLDTILDILNTDSEKAFIEYWKTIEKSSEISKKLPRKQIKQLCGLWAIEAKVLKLAFLTTITEITYKELQESLRKEHKMLIQIKMKLRE
ncbi:17960_t:CDS:2, partial [Racocetra persica]